MNLLPKALISLKDKIIIYLHLDTAFRISRKT